MNSLQINCFLTAAKYKSFSKAATSLFISQPTISRNISALEEEFGIQLFRRNSFHGIELTESGKIMEKSLKTARKEVLSGLEKARMLEKEAQIQLALGLLYGQFLDDKLEDLLARFRLSYPKVTISIHRNDYQGIMASLQANELDIIYLPQWQFQDTSLQIFPIGKMETILVVPKRLMPGVEDREYSLTEFAQFPFITVDVTESRISRNMLTSLFAELGISPLLAETSSFQKQIQKVETGEAVILINPYNSVCYSPNVHCVHIKELQPQPFAIGWKRSGNSACIDLFRSFLQSCADGHKLQ